MTTRDAIDGPDAPEPPFPLKVSGKVIKGFGRGSSELGIPTANLPVEGLSVGGHEGLQNGVYYGWAALDFHHAPAAAADASAEAQPPSLADKAKHADGKLFDETAADEDDLKDRVHPMVMSIGWNPFYKNTVRSVEVHIMHTFVHNFYGRHMNILITGFVRRELDYVSKEALIADIMTDIRVARKSLAKPAFARLAEDPWLKEFPTDGEGRSLRGDVAT